MLLRIKELNRQLEEARSSQYKYDEEIQAFHDRMSVVDRHWSQVGFEIGYFGTLEWRLMEVC